MISFLSENLLPIMLLIGVGILFAYGVYVARTQRHGVRNKAKPDRRKIPRESSDRRLRHH